MESALAQAEEGGPVFVKWMSWHLSKQSSLNIAVKPE